MQVYVFALALVLLQCISLSVIMSHSPLAQEHDAIGCNDSDPSCGWWKQNGQCRLNLGVQAKCQKSCGLCVAATCGQRPPIGRVEVRVINGENASPNSWPWQIALRKNGKDWCGSSLIEPDWVVTAAHCVYDDRNLNAYRVVVGAHQKTGVTPFQETLAIRKMIIHKGFSWEHTWDDIALLQLERPVKLSPQVNTVCLPQAGTKARVGARCYVTGWGYMNGDNGRILPEVLQQAILPIALQSDCARVNGVLGSVDENTMICAGGEGRGGCKGDSGGPLVCEEGGRWVLRGAGSWRQNKCNTNYYTVFTRISSFIEWINQKKAGCSDSDRSCGWWKQNGQCKLNLGVQTKCQKSCGLCGAR